MSNPRDDPASAAERRPPGVEERHLYRRLRAEAGVARAVAEAGLDFDRTAAALAARIAAELDDGCVIRVLTSDGRGLRRVAAEHPDPELRDLLRDAPDLRLEDAPQHAAVLREQRTLVADSVDTADLRRVHPPERWPLLDRYPQRAALLAPLAVAGRALGTLALWRFAASPRMAAFTAEEQQLGETLAWHAARALESARRFADTKTAADQRQWLEAVLDRAPMAMVFVDPATTRVTFANRAAHALAGGQYPMDAAALQSGGSRFVDGDGRPLPEEDTPRARIARGQTLVAAPFSLHTPGGVRQLLVHADLVPPLAGQSATGVVLFQDVTDLKEVEARLRAADRVKDEFLATVSHELRTPLNAILGWAHILRERQREPAMIARAADTILRNVDTQARLVSDILDISHITSGRLRLSVREVDLAAVVQSAIDTLSPAADARGIQVQATFDPASGPVSADPERLRQAVWNVLSNAVKFTPRGGTVQVSVQAMDSRMEIVVEDSGPGFDPAFLPHLFERFRQADASITRRHGGVGLGLAIVRQLVELHGGDVSASNAERGGARVAIRLPRPVQAVQRDLPFVPPVTDAPVPVLAGLHVVVVDDDPDGRDMAAFVLRAEGAQVVVAGSAEEALRIVQRDRPQVLLADIEMPGVDGYELLRQVRALPADRGGRTPAAALTAYAGPRDRVKALRAGFQIHVPKPVEPKELVAVVASLAAR